MMSAVVGVEELSRLFDEVLKPQSKRMEVVFHRSEVCFRNNACPRLGVPQAQLDYFLVINDYHAYCKLCSHHLYSQTWPKDINSFFEDHINSRWHNFVCKKVCYPYGQPIFSWTKWLYTGQCNACAKSVDAHIIVNGSSIVEVVHQHIRTRHHTNNFNTRQTNQSKHVHIVRKLSLLNTVMNKCIRNIGTERLCTLCCVTLKGDITEFHLESQGHYNEFVKHLEKTYGYNIQEYMNGFVVEEVLKKLVDPKEQILLARVVTESETEEKYLSEADSKPDSDKGAFCPRQVEALMKMHDVDFVRDRLCTLCELKITDLNLHVKSSPHQKRLAAIATLDPMTTAERYQVYVKNRADRLSPHGIVLAKYEAVQTALAAVGFRLGMPYNTQLDKIQVALPRNIKLPEVTPVAKKEIPAPSKSEAPPSSGTTGRNVMDVVFKSLTLEDPIVFVNRGKLSCYCRICNCEFERTELDTHKAGENHLWALQMNLKAQYPKALYLDALQPYLKDWACCLCACVVPESSIVSHIMGQQHEAQYQSSLKDSRRHRLNLEEFDIQTNMTKCKLCDITLGPVTPSLQLLQMKQHADGKRHQTIQDKNEQKSKTATKQISNSMKDILENLHKTNEDVVARNKQLVDGAAMLVPCVFCSTPLQESDRQLHKCPRKVDGENSNVISSSKDVRQTIHLMMNGQRDGTHGLESGHVKNILENLCKSNEEVVARNKTLVGEAAMLVPCAVCSTPLLEHERQQHKCVRKQAKSGDGELDVDQLNSTLLQIVDQVKTELMDKILDRMGIESDSEIHSRNSSESSDVAVGAAKSAQRRLVNGLRTDKEENGETDDRNDAEDKNEEDFDFYNCTLCRLNGPVEYMEKHINSEGHLQKEVSARVFGPVRIRGCSLCAVMMIGNGASIRNHFISKIHKEKREIETIRKLDVRLNDMNTVDVLLVTDIPKSNHRYESVMQAMKKFGTVRNIRLTMREAIVEFVEPWAVGKVMDSRPVFIMDQAVTISVSREKGLPKYFLSEDMITLLRDPKGLVKHAFELKKVADELMNRHVERMKEDMVFKTLISALAAVYPYCRPYPFGSRLSGLTLDTSDFDIFLDCDNLYKGQVKQEPRLQEEIVANVSKALMLNADCTDIHCVPRARVPIVSFLHVPSQLHCDVSFKNGLSCQNTQLIRLMVSFDWRVKPLILFLKNWVESNKLHGPPLFSSYAVTMLVIFYLGQLNSPVLPTVEQLQNAYTGPRITIGGWDCSFCTDLSKLPKCTNTDSLDKLIYGFFTFYASFRYNEFIITPLTCRPLQRRTVENRDRCGMPMPFKRQMYQIPIEIYARSMSPMCIMDPFDLSHNLTKNVPKYGLELFTYFCESSAALLLGVPQ